MNRKRLFLYFLLLPQFGLGQINFEKRECATSLADKNLKIKYSNYKNIIENGSDFQKHVLKLKNSRISADTLIIPIIVHVVHNGDAIGTNENISKDQVYSQIEVLNEDFQRKQGSLGFNTNPVGVSMPIKFMPAFIDENDSLLAEPGIHRINGNRESWNNTSDIDDILKPRTQFDPTKYLNIWVVAFGGSMATQLGYGQFPDLSSLSGIDMYNGVAQSDGLVIRFNAFGRRGNLKSPYNKGRTLTHEMGHFLGLLHIWGIYDDNLDCSEEDGCNDTPKTKGPIYNCPSVVASCSAGVNAMKENYLDYSNDACMNTFTEDQAARIMTVLANCPRRKELTSSKVYINPNTITGISNGITNSDFDLFPNPVENLLTITSNQEIVNVIMVNAMGETILINSVSKSDLKKIEIPTFSLAKGIYFVKIQFKNGWFTHKVVKC